MDRRAAQSSTPRALARAAALASRRPPGGGAWCSIGEPRYDEAVRAFTQAIRTQPDAATAYVYHGIALFEAGGDAWKTRWQTSPRRPEGAIVPLYRSDSYLALGQRSRAVPTTGGRWTWRGRRATGRDRAHQALAAGPTAIGRTP